ncbi:MAG: hypothetical protein ABH858_01590 [Candidatus Omnitrophota bacterium]
MKERGCLASLIRAKLFGGAHMFSAISVDSPLNIGAKNVEKSKEVLAACKIKIVAEETGGSYGRTIEFNLADGKVRVKTIFHGEKEL